MSNETKTCKPGDLLHCCLYFTANSLARNIGRLAYECFRPTGLSPSHAFVLMLVDEKPGITPKQLSEKLHLAPSTITRFLDALEGKGLLERRVSGKSAEIHPSDEGRAMAEPIARAWKDIYWRYCEVLGEDEARALTRIVDEANSKLEG